MPVMYCFIRRSGTILPTLSAKKLSHDLTLHYGLLSVDCKSEDEYIDKAEQLTRVIMQAEDAELEDLFWGNHFRFCNFTH